MVGNGKKAIAGAFWSHIVNIPLDERVYGLG